ncbi:MAG: Spo0E family sporulation regulatory protein-aspartic acid phosphatase [Clostridia bacterium]|nr:Spo0E family sporulation regulatory protein-aspartic acid phosphatase [Clostridia bacterium]
MSKELMYVLITKMHIKLNKVIENNNFDLLNDEVQIYSRRLDRVLSRYNKVLKNSKNTGCRYCRFDQEKS